MVFHTYTHVTNPLDFVGITHVESAGHVIERLRIRFPAGAVGEFSSQELIFCHHQHHHQLSLNREGRWGTTDDFETSFLHISLYSTAL